MSSTPSTSSTPTNVANTPQVAPNLELVREEDFVEYFIFPAPTEEEPSSSDLENLLERINKQLDQHISDYIWHKDAFNLSIRTNAHQKLNEDQNNEKQIPLPPHLHGISHYGDNIQDEWFIVYLLYEITRENAGIVARVIDADGEFLVIEAADHLPNWANPDTCEQRVYISDGHLMLVQNSPTNTTTVLPVVTALTKIAQNPTLYRVSSDIQNCINERLKNFSTAEARLAAVHSQIVNLPMGVAAILRLQPSLLPPACRAFCERDKIDMKACRAMRFFPPEDRVRTMVRFTRCLYAMMMHIDYLPDRRTGWNLPSAVGSDEYKEDLLGIKIACGFEILSSQAKKDDMSEDDQHWRTYLQCLAGKEYFKGNLEGSAKYNQLLEEAKSFYQSNRTKFRTRPEVGKIIVDMLETMDPVVMEQLRDDENNLPCSNSDDWLNISPEELDAELTKKYGVKRLYTSAGDVNAKEFTSNIAEFLDRQSEFDGIENQRPEPTVRKANIRKNLSMRRAVKQNPISTSASPGDQSVNFDPDEFTTHVKNFLDFVIPEDNWESNSEMSEYEDEDDLEKNMEEMANSEFNIKSYMDQMDRELAQTTIGQSFQKSPAKRPKSAYDDDFDDIESFKPIDININTLKNMMDSYKSQVGGPGPASNLLNAMGVGMENHTAPLANVKPSEEPLEEQETPV